MGGVLLLAGCGGEEEPPRNVRLDELRRVGGEDEFYMATDLQCEVLTATKASEVGTVFQLRSLNTTPTIAFADEMYDPIEMEQVSRGVKLLAYIVISNRYGQSYLLLDTEEGVFSLSNIDIVQTGDKSTLRGNCIPTELLEQNLTQ